MQIDRFSVEGGEIASRSCDDDQILDEPGQPRILPFDHPARLVTALEVGVAFDDSDRGADRGERLPHFMSDGTSELLTGLVETLKQPGRIFVV